LPGICNHDNNEDDNILNDSQTEQNHIYHVCTSPPLPHPNTQLRLRNMELSYSSTSEIQRVYIMLVLLNVCLALTETWETEMNQNIKATLT